MTVSWLMKRAYRHHKILHRFAVEIIVSAGQCMTEWGCVCTFILQSVRGLRRRHLWCHSYHLQTVSVEHRSAAFWAECCLDVWVCTRQRVWSKCSMLVREQEPAIQQCMTSLWFHHELEILPHRLLVQWTSIELKRVKINTAHTHHVGREIKPAFQTTNRLLSHIMWVHPCIDQLQSTTVSAFCCT